MLTRPEGSVVATPGLAAYMTWKQAELLLIVADAPKRLPEIGDVVREIHQIDMAAGNRPLYWGVDNTAIRSTLNTLVRRRLLREGQDDRWYLTDKGREAAEMMR